MIGWAGKICALLLLPGAFFIAYSGFIYVTAPVDSMRGVVTYTPPFKNYTRQAGLALPGNLMMNQMPDHLILATLVAEDDTFPFHHGIRPEEMLIRLKEYMAGHNTRHEGCCSTITQQLAKNIFTGPEYSLYRKYIEAIYALKIERHFTKTEIFTLYINMAEVGPDTYGFKAAAKKYFNKDAKQLLPVESVFIVSNLPSPTKRSGWFRENADDPSALQRIAFELRNTALLREQMAEEKLLPSETQKDFFIKYKEAYELGRLSLKQGPDTFSALLTLHTGYATCNPEERYIALIKYADLQTLYFIHLHSPAVSNVKKILNERSQQKKAPPEKRYC